MKSEQACSAAARSANVYWLQECRVLPLSLRQQKLERSFREDCIYWLGPFVLIFKNSAANQTVAPDLVFLLAESAGWVELSNEAKSKNPCLNFWPHLPADRLCFVSKFRSVPFTVLKGSMVTSVSKNIPRCYGVGSTRFVDGNSLT